ncbi:(R,R)-butanediol dehydrogenase/meso-butanediol dehydrogenase/diacetyl reductase [Microbacteriaceae bacterium SG_E_30_P1]|uniref:(R,R)-butanediol dehydrogenase/meso-butanediol dehydrogenase/diacetyl reductase n=1 Tax=Antiquaquibacter oligotrophicus TaxID=2880260 RepID=A0ABT6KJP2_9MICO|nr:alcohol dehydrogenase catalytic domain-containing protein [Antiquaquibacter oligotrophicus]MDH6180178.1 (R,R)-butanediol dehydrogenase/meso-butanediol dehydrogenase/diacetyl reductase [Antiquaquibacter oligotrophicus]UDF14070.1 alcohol dehydrogenase catalytic domain-containing protein [Antiquaquibacter oligotrophicus]
MRTAAYTGNHAIEISETEASAPGHGEVQIAVAYTGLCGTDLHILHGNMDARVTTPLTFGHEMSGTISAVGDGVTEWKTGDHVTVMPLEWDGTCPACIAGSSHICQNLVFVGIDSPGSLQERWNVSADLLVAVPDDLSLENAALAEPVAVAVHDVRRSELKAGDHVVVLGGGPIGVLIASVARSEGAIVAVSEPEPQRREQIARLGFETIDPREVDAAEWVTAWTDGAGADVVFEVSGAPAAVLAATGLAKVRGTIVVVAIHPTPREIDLQRVFWRELRILGARVYQRTDFERAIELLRDGTIPVDEVISKIVPLDQISDGVSDLENGRALKVLVEIGGAA